MSIDSAMTLGRIDAPFGKSIELQNVEYTEGMALLRVRIREGKRFTIIELDPDSARQWLTLMGDWIRRQPAGTVPS